MESQFGPQNCNPTCSYGYFNSFHFCGGTSIMIGLKKFIAETLGIELNPINPFEKITQNQSVDNPEIFAIAMGMAIRGISEA